VHPFLISLGLEPLTVYDTPCKQYPFVTRIRSFVRNIAEDEFFRDATRERGTR
jgi:hypothetical protein